MKWRERRSEKNIVIVVLFLDICGKVYAKILKEMNRITLLRNNKVTDSRMPACNLVAAS